MFIIVCHYLRGGECKVSMNHNQNSFLRSRDVKMNQFIDKLSTVELIANSDVNIF